jgi:Na+-driven multidrug efflux pump
MSRKSSFSPGLYSRNGSNLDDVPEADLEFINSFPMTLSKFLWPFLKKSLPLTIMRSATNLLYLCCFYFLAWFESPTMTAGFGIANSCYAFFCLLIALINGDCMAVWCSIYIGMEEWRDMRLTYYRGVGFSFIITLVAACLFIRID